MTSPDDVARERALLLLGDAWVRSAPVLPKLWPKLFANGRSVLSLWCSGLICSNPSSACVALNQASETQSSPAAEVLSVQVRFPILQNIAEFDEFIQQHQLILYIEKVPQAASPGIA